MHESQGKNDHQHHHDQGIDLPRVWPLSWLLGVEGANKNPMRQHINIGCKIQEMYHMYHVYCMFELVWRVQIFEESIIIYYPYLAIPKPLKLWQKKQKLIICILPKFIIEKLTTSLSAEKPNLLLHLPAWIHGYSAGPRSWNLLQTEPTVGPVGPRKRQEVEVFFFGIMHGAQWRENNETKVRDLINSCPFPSPLRDF